jgi:mono/diheme cytochrome c family protein
MRVRLDTVLTVVAGLFIYAAPVGAQDAGTRPGATPAAAPNPGRELVAGKCFQCHTDSMFRDGRMERVGWEAAIYRMIGRGGQYTTEEIKQLADYLGTEFGPNARPASQSR